MSYPPRTFLIPITIATLTMDPIYSDETFIQTNEVLLHENGYWLHFREPQRIIIAKELEEVLPALHEIEQLIKIKGWYAAGFLSYEAASAFDSALRTHTARSSAYSSALPYLWFGLYPQPLIIALPKPNRPKEVLDWQPRIDHETYDSAIAKIKDHIAEGRTYQVNYTVRLQAGFTGSAWNFFLHIVQKQNQHAAYIDTGRYVICSASPELFFRLDGDMITCRPIDRKSVV